jgi:hypothetical protein
MFGHLVLNITKSGGIERTLYWRKETYMFAVNNSNTETLSPNGVLTETGNDFKISHEL